MTGEGAPGAPWTEQRFRAFYERMLPRLAAVLGRYQIPREDGEDLLQQAFVTFLRRSSEVEDPEAWLLGTVRNLSLMYWRNRRSRRDMAVDPTDLESAARALVTGGERLPQERLEMQGDLERYLARLPPRHRCLLRLRFALGYATAEVATLLGRHPSNVSRGVHRGLSELVRLMEEDDDPGDSARSSRRPKEQPKRAGARRRRTIDA